MRNYTTQHVPGAHLNFDQRLTLASDWNRLLENHENPSAEQENHALVRFPVEFAVDGAPLQPSNVGYVGRRRRRDVRRAKGGASKIDSGVCFYFLITT